MAIALRPLATDDTWWQLAMGRLYAGGDLWPRADPLLHTTVLRAPVPHEWLFQVGLFQLLESFGFGSLRVAHGVALAMLGGGVFAVFRRASRDRVPAALASLVFIALAWFRLVQLRPELLSALAVLALYALLWAPPAGPSRWRIAASALLFLIWVNSHSLFAIGLCLLIAALCGTALHALLRRRVRDPTGEPDPNASRARRLGLALGVGVAITALNPRGFAQHLTFFTESQAGLIWKIRDDFLPWNPFAPALEAGPAFSPLAWGLSDVLYGLVLSCAAWRLGVFWRARSAGSLAAFDALQLGLALAAGLASLVSVRFHWLAFFPLLYLLRQWRLWDPRPAGVRPALVAAAVALAVATPLAGNFAAYWSELSHEPEGYRGEWMDERYCGPGMRFLRDARLEGRLYQPFNLGGFLGYWLAPRLTTFIDGRLDHVPAEVLDDYLAIRRASLTGPTGALRERLDRWGIDLFFADAFPAEWYENRVSGTHLRRLPEWIRIYASRSHAIYLRRNPRNRANLERVVAYYASRGVPFDVRRGLQVGRVLAQAPAWAESQRLRLPNQRALEQLAVRGSGEAQALALDRLAAQAWRLADFDAQVPLDRALLRARPSDRRAGIRLADALIQQGRSRAALEVLAPLLRDAPEDGQARYLERIARRGVPDSID